MTGNLLSLKSYLYRRVVAQLGGKHSLLMRIFKWPPWVLERPLFVGIVRKSSKGP